MIKLCIPDIKELEIASAVDALESGWLAHGPYNKKFEEKFADFVGVKHAISCNSCTSALFLVLKALDITGEVIIPSFSFVATANAVVTAGAVPRFVDIDYQTCNIDPKNINSAITSNTKAIMPVHFGGQCCEMDKIMKIADKHDLIVIEDTAETLGGKINNKQAGSFGIGCFSFFPTKNITTGEGGMITTNDDDLARNCRALLGHGIDSNTFEREKDEMPWYRSAVIPGYNFRMSNVLAAIGYEQIKRIDELNELRKDHANYYIENLSEISDIDLPYTSENCEHVYQMFTIKLNNTINRNSFVKQLNKKGIGASVHFYPPIHQQPFYKKRVEWIAEKLDVTENVSNKIVTLPLYPGMKKKEIDLVIKTIKTILN